MSDPSNIRNHLIASGNNSHKMRSNCSEYKNDLPCKPNDIKLGNKLVKGLSSLRTFMDFDGLNETQEHEVSERKINPFIKLSQSSHNSCALVYSHDYVSGPKLLAYSPSKIVAKAVVPGGSLELLPPAVQNDSIASSSSQQRFHNLCSYSIWKQLRFGKRTRVGEGRDKTNNGGSYWTRGRRTLKETADFFKNLPRLNPNHSQAYLEYGQAKTGHDLKSYEHSENIVNQVLAKPYGSPFAAQECGFLTSFNNVRDHEDALSAHKSMNGTSDDSIRSLLSLIEQEDDNCERLDFGFNSSKTQPSAYNNVCQGENSAIFDGQTCSLIKEHKSINTNTANDQQMDVPLVEAQVVSSSSLNNSLLGRSAYKGEQSSAFFENTNSAIDSNRPKEKHIAKSIKAKNWGNNLYVQLCADNAPSTKSSPENLDKSNAPSKAINDVSQALVSLLGFNNIEVSHDLLLQKDEVRSLKSILEHPCQIVDTKVILTNFKDLKNKE